MLLNTVVEVGKGVLFFPILERHGKRTALAYLATMIVEVVLLGRRGARAAADRALAQQAADAGAASAGWATALGALAVQSNAVAYNAGRSRSASGCLLPLRAAAADRAGPSLPRHRGPDRLPGSRSGVHR